MVEYFLILKLAWRNLIRNRIRTAIILTMIVGSYSAIIFFKGFANNILIGIAEESTTGSSGHIQIATNSLWQGEFPKDKNLNYVENFRDLSVKLKSISGVKSVFSRASPSVLLSTPDKSFGAVAVGFDPKEEVDFRSRIRVVEGLPFSDQNDFEILVGYGLKSALNLKAGQSISVISQTLAGSMSSVDLEIRGFIKTGLSELDSKIVYISLRTAKKLLATDRSERILLMLKKGTNVDEALSKVNTTLTEYPKLAAKKWSDINSFYLKIQSFYAVQNLIVEIFLSVLVFFGILNTIGMSIYERIGELGTLRALGDHKKDVIFLIATEGTMLGVLGVTIGVPFSFIFSAIFSALGFEAMLPAATLPVKLAILPTPYDYFISALVLCIICLASVLLPCKKAMSLSIVDALRFNS